MSVIAVIPARGGSKGILRKNLAMCAGKPLVDWVIQAANDSELINWAILSSDNDEILQRAWGKVVAQRRPAELATDEASTEDVMEYALRDASEDVIVLLQPTSPLTEGWQIDEAIRVLERGAASVVSVVESHAFLWHNGEYANVPMYDMLNRPRRQDRFEYEENGAIYVTTSEKWHKHHVRASGKIGLYEMPEEHRFQVDTPLDLDIVSKLLNEREARKCVSA